MTPKQKKWLQILKKAALGVGIAVILILPQIAWAQGFLPLPDAETLGDVPDPEGEGLQKAYNLVWELARNYRYIIGAVAIAMMSVAGVKMVIQGDNEEVINKQKANLVWGGVGLALIALAGPMAEILDLQEGGFLSDQYEIGYRARLFDAQAQIVLVFIKYLVGGVAVAFMIRSGAKLVTEGDDETVVSNEKKNLLQAGLALFMILMADTVIKEVLFKVEPASSTYSGSGQGANVEIDVERGLDEIVGITNFIVSWAAPVALLVLIGGAVMYVTAFGDEERTGNAKKIIINAATALIVIYGAFAIVSTLISGVF